VGQPILAAAGFPAGVEIRVQPKEPPDKAAAGTIACPTTSVDG